jgi:hypothetical protein
MYVTGSFLKHGIVIRVITYPVFYGTLRLKTIFLEVHSEITERIRRHIGGGVHVSSAVLLLRKLVTRDENNRVLHGHSAHSTAHLRVKRHADSHSGIT